MSYNPATDFPGMLRLIGSSLRSERVPGLNFVVDALARAGLFALSVGQTPPTVNQASTFWFQPAIPSWTAEGTLYIWSPAAQAYEAATPALWQAFLSPLSVAFQTRIVTSSVPFTLNNTDGAVGFYRTAGLAAMNVAMPTAPMNGQAVSIADLTGGVNGFQPYPITMVANVGQTIAGLVEVVLNVNRGKWAFEFYSTGTGTGVWDAGAV